MLGNSEATYGAVTKTFHWLTVLLMVTVIPLGIFAHDLPYATGEELTRKAWYFSLHKTVGITLFFTALARIAWAVFQPKPFPLSGSKQLEHWLAETVHWVLYSALVIVPLTGWIHHAASEGFAPIWWSFGQNLPLIPKNETVSHVFKVLHFLTKNLLVAAILLHIVGALKHHFIDRDVTLRRMLPGRTDPGLLPPPAESRLPMVAAGAAYLLAIALGSGLFATPPQNSVAVPELEQQSSEWAVQEGTLTITVDQLGSKVEGRFAVWTAVIDFDEEPDANGLHGSVDVVISVPSLTLGSVTAQALGSEFFDAELHQTGQFKAQITSAADSYLAAGTLTLKDVEAPIELPFTLEIDGDTAKMSGETVVQRLTFNIGETYPDESSVGFNVGVAVSLTATRN